MFSSSPLLLSLSSSSLLFISSGYILLHSSSAVSGSTVNPRQQSMGFCNITTLALLYFTFYVNLNVLKIIQGTNISTNFLETINFCTFTLFYQLTTVGLYCQHSLSMPGCAWMTDRTSTVAARAIVNTFLIIMIFLEDIHFTGLYESRKELNLFCTNVPSSTPDLYTENSVAISGPLRQQVRHLEDEREKLCCIFQTIIFYVFSPTHLLCCLQIFNQSNGE